MAKKSIVFVSFDEEYIATIEYKLTRFIEKYADIEFITKESAYNKLISEHRIIDLLILPEGTLFQTSVDSSKTTVIYITEEKKESKENNYIYKYYPLEYISKIIIKNLACKKTIDGAHGTQIIGVYSVAGGAGKTITALSLSYKLRKLGYKVLYISTVPEQDFTYYMKYDGHLSNQFSQQCSINMKSALKLLKDEVENEDFDFLPKFKNLPVSYQISFDIYVQIISQFKDKNIYDYIVVELSSDIQIEKIKFMRNCDKLVVLTTQDYIAISKLETFMDNVANDIPEIILVCNKYNKYRKDYIKESYISRYYDILEYIDEYGQALTFENVKKSALYNKLISALC